MFLAWVHSVCMCIAGMPLTRMMHPVMLHHVFLLGVPLTDMRGARLDMQLSVQLVCLSAFTHHPAFRTLPSCEASCCMLASQCCSSVLLVCCSAQGTVCAESHTRVLSVQRATPGYCLCIEPHQGTVCAESHTRVLSAHTCLCTGHAVALWTTA
jgi:hypothetical protein